MQAGESSTIYGSVKASDIVQFFEKQTGRVLDEKEITLPEIKKLGTYEGSVRLHPEVVGNFKVQVTKQAN